MQIILQNLYNKIINSTTTIYHLEGVLSWIAHNELKEEHKNDLVGAYEKINEGDINKNANFITSHIIYNFKTIEAVSYSMKARIFPHGNKYNPLNYIRTYSATALFNSIRLLLSLATLLNMGLGWSI